MGEMFSIIILVEASLNSLLDEAFSKFPSDDDFSHDCSIISYDNENDDSSISLESIPSYFNI